MSQTAALLFHRITIRAARHPAVRIRRHYINHVFDDKVLQRGCVFHWIQTVWRKVQQFGGISLHGTWCHAPVNCRHRSDVMSLPFLPAADIEPAFQHIKARMQSNSLLQGDTLFSNLTPNLILRLK